MDNRARYRPPTSQPQKASNEVRRGIMIGCGSMLAIAFVLGLVGAGFAYQVFKELDDQKPAAMAAVNRITKCLLSGGTSCVEALTTWDPKMRKRSISQRRRISRRLGRRLGGTPVEDSWGLNKRGANKPAEGRPVGDLLTVQYRSTFEKDDAVTESFSFVVTDGVFLLLHYNVDSAVLDGLEEPTDELPTHEKEEPREPADWLEDPAQARQPAATPSTEPGADDWLQPARPLRPTEPNDADDWLQ